MEQLTAAGLAGIAALRISEALHRDQIDKVWARLSKDSRIILLQRSSLHYRWHLTDWDAMPKPERKAIETALTGMLTFLASAGMDHAEARIAAARVAA
jgi:hypothetical protein